MKHLGRVLLPLSVVVVSAVAASAEQVECEGPAKRVKAVAAPGQHIAQVDFSASGGGFDPMPLLSTTVDVDGHQPSCLVAHFSTLATPQDNHIMFQVRVDGVPMIGHGFTPGFSTPVVFDPQQHQDIFGTIVKMTKMVGYDFFAEVSPGSHRVEVLYAGCCSGDPNAHSGVVQSPVLTLEYR